LRAEVPPEVGEGFDEGGGPGGEFVVAEGAVVGWKTVRRRRE